jgi:hypothetical protein
MYMFCQGYPSSKMVFLSQIRNEWPWKKDAVQNLADKEILTHTVYPHDADSTWRVKILPPMDGYAYIGVQVSVADQPEDYAVMTRLVFGDTNRPVFGAPWDNTLSANGEWKELGFPIMHKLLAITEDSMDLILQWEAPRYGRVSLLAQRLDDFMIDDSQIAYAFLNDRQQRVKFLLTAQGSFFQPGSWDGNLYEGPVKVLPMLYRVLHPNEPEWSDRDRYWYAVTLNSSIDEIMPFPAPAEELSDEENELPQN